MRPVFALMVTAALMVPLAAQAQEIVRRVSVTGEGRVEAAPDIAVITLGVTYQARGAAEAMDAVSTDVRRVIEQLVSFGVTEADIRTTSLSLNQVYERRPSNAQPPRIIGFAAANTIMVTVRDLDRLGRLLDRVIEAGANNFRGFRFDLSDRSAALDAARKAAVADALARARLYAEAASVQLGEVLSITESPGAVAPAPMLRMEAMAADSIPIAPGALTISAQIGLTIALK